MLRNERTKRYRANLSPDSKAAMRASWRQAKQIKKVEEKLAAVRVTERNRVRKMAQRLKVSIPKDENLFTEVLLHIARSEERYQNAKNKSPKAIEICLTVSRCKAVNKTLRVIKTLRMQRRQSEQQRLVASLRLELGSYRNIATFAGSTVKYVHTICSVPKDKVHRATQRFLNKKDEFHQFLSQDSISFALPGKRYAGKRYLNGTWERVTEKYEQQPEFHTKGKIAASTMRTKAYHLEGLQLSSRVPYNQCLCSTCCNFDMIREALINAGVKGIASNKYKAVHSTLCADRVRQYPTNHTFPRKKCLTRSCEDCNLGDVLQRLQELNQHLSARGTTIKWWQWRQGKLDASKPLKIMKSGSLTAALKQYIAYLEEMPMHLFKADWHRNLISILKSNLKPGYVLQISDYAKNFSLRYQDEPQSAFFQCGSVTIIATANYYQCPIEGCEEMVTDYLVHISDDMKHDSFTTRAALKQSFQYLVDKGVYTDYIIHISDNCAAEFKSARNIAELARNIFNITRLYLGPAHAKNICDSIFGKVKSWMEKRIRSRQSVVRDAKEFFEVCKAHYPGQLTDEETTDGCCHHHIMKFVFLSKTESKRHHDCTLETSLPGTRAFYAFQNTAEPLQVKARHVPCVCEACIEGVGECINPEFTDAWSLKTLIPKAGDNRRKHEKRRNLMPNLLRGNAILQPECDAEVAESADELDEEGHAPLDETHDVVTGEEEDEDEEELEDAEMEQNLVQEIIEDVEVLSVIEVNENEYAAIAHQMECEQQNFFERNETPAAFDDDSEDIFAEQLISFDDSFVPNNAPYVRRQNEEKDYWEEFLEKLGTCQTIDELQEVIDGEQDDMPALPNVICPGFLDGDFTIDAHSTGDYPSDAPSNTKVISCYGDGNCLARSISILCFGTDRHYHEVRVRMVIEGVQNREHYLNDEYLSRGATHHHRRAKLSQVYAQYGEHIRHGQKLDRDNVATLYDMELLSIARDGTYCGIWQFFQACNAVNMPLRGIYPMRGASTIRKDFNRVFYPISCPDTVTEDESLPLLNIMWTSTSSSKNVNHFVPVLYNTHQ